MRQTRQRDTLLDIGMGVTSSQPIQKCVDNEPLPLDIRHGLL